MTEASEPTETVKIDVQGGVVDEIITLLRDKCQGPRDAFCVLVIALIKMDQINAFVMGTEPDNDRLIEAITQAINTAEPIKRAEH